MVSLIVDDNALYIEQCNRATEEVFLYFGGSIGYWQGNIKTLIDDISACKPTLFAGVPRVFDR